MPSAIVYVFLQDFIMDGNGEGTIIEAAISEIVCEQEVAYEEWPTIDMHKVNRPGKYFSDSRFATTADYEVV